MYVIYACIYVCMTVPEQGGKKEKLFLDNEAKMSLLQCVLLEQRT